MRIIVFILLLPALVFEQVEISSGNYDALNLAFDKNSKLVTGYYENATGWDEKSQSPKFSCVFYFLGTLVGNRITIKSLAPKYVEGGIISGTLTTLKNNQLKIQLTEDHGGCWNVQHFADEPASFNLVEKKPWIQIRYISIEKVYFHSNENDKSKLKSYVLKGDIVYVEKINKDWAYCSFIGKKVTRGWLKTSALNSL